MKNKIRILLLAITCLIGIYWINNEIHWRQHNDNSIEVDNELDLNKVKIKWIDYNREETVFFNGKLIKKLDDIVPFQWNITYSDSMFVNIDLSANDKRQDFNYHFSLFRKDNTLFCELIAQEKNTIFNNIIKQTLPLKAK
jgi:hypothetical protein